MTTDSSYRQLRVFVSSTFNDFREERTLLVGKIFPMVADYCHKRKLEFIGVDLRWGVSEEQSKRGETVDVCMYEIDRCRPLFIGLIGERYGWIPAGSDISVTEKEIIYGALDAPSDTQAFFYLRDPDLTEQMFGPSDPDPQLEDLKNRIRQSRYPKLDGYHSLDEFGKHVFTDLIDVVDRIAAQSAETNPVMKIREEQLFIARRLTANYVDRPQLNAAWKRAFDNNQLILITGPAGTGKTSFLSRWITDNCEHDNIYLFPFFIGSTGENNWEQIVRQLTDELRLAFCPDYPIPQDREQLRRSVSILLNIAAKHKPVVIAIDRMDQLPMDDRFSMSWLPERLPEGVRVLVTLNESAIADKLRTRQHSEFRLEPLTPDEIEQISVNYLSFYSKNLSLRHIKALREAENTKNPLYLITLLNEIRQIGRHRQLNDQLQEYLACADINALFQRVLQRLEHEHDRNCDALTQRFLSLAEVCRGGISENEAMSLLGDIPQVRLSPLLLALDSYLSFSGGAIRIAVPEFARAVRARYALDELRITEIQASLIKWFSSHPQTQRYSYILPWLLKNADRYDELYTMLSDPITFDEIWKRNPDEVKAYWTYLSDNGHSPKIAYDHIPANAESISPEILIDIAELMIGLGDSQLSSQILNVITSDGFAITNELKVRAFGILGTLYQRAGRASDAEKYYRSQYALAWKTNDRYQQQRAMGNIGLLAMMRGDLNTARDHFERVLALAEALNHRETQQVALGNLGNIAFSVGEIEKARMLYLKQKMICKESGNTDGLIHACGALGILLCKQKDYTSAEQEFITQESLSRSTSSVDGLSNALGNLALLAQSQGDTNRAETLLLEKRTLCKNTGFFQGEQNALGNLCELTIRKGQPEQALEYAKQRTVLALNHRAFRVYAQALVQMASVEQALGLDSEAKQHKLQAMSIAAQHRFTLNHPN